MPRLEKTETVWPIRFRLTARENQVGRWTAFSWTVEDITLAGKAKLPGLACVPLSIHKDERTDYRFNLSSQDPTLFFVCEEDEEQLIPLLLTASQSVAGSYMDGEYKVLNHKMPLAVQAWIEAFIGRHGEQIEVKRKKNKGKGRSSGN